MSWLQKLRSKSIRRRLVLLVVLSGVLLVTSALLTNHAINLQQSDAVLETLAGRQGMLTQRIAQSVYMLHYTRGGYQPYEVTLQELIDSVSLYDETLTIFMQGGTIDLQEVYTLSPLTNHMDALKTIQTEWNAFKRQLGIIITYYTVLNPPVDSVLEKALQYVADKNETLLQQADALALLLQSDMQNHITYKDRIIVGFLFIKLFVLLMFLYGINIGIIRPFKRLLKVIRSMDENTYTHTPNPEKFIEWHTINERVRQLYENLTKTQDDMNLLNVALEDKVKVRTKELEKSYQKLAESEKQASLSVLVAGVAHEINTPIGACITAATQAKKENSTLIKKTKAGELSADEFIDYVQTNTKLNQLIHFNLERTAEIISSFKRISVSQAAATIRKFDLKRNLNDVWVSLTYLHKKHSVEFVNDIPHIIVYGDTGDYYQVFSNLITNTLVHGYKQGAKARINVSAETAGKRLKIVYTDHGKGIPASIRDKIFDPFFTTNRAKGSSGLGLNIVYQIIVHKLGGEIECDSRQRRYTTFTITIPDIGKEDAQ